jgi:RNA ligase (TIGR02306 family)
MSISETNFKVPLTRILKIYPHTNADKLEIAQVYGYDCIVSKGSYTVGEQVIYIPIDSIIPQCIEDYVFKNSKLDRKSSKNRIRQIRIRSVPSQGLLLKQSEVYTLFGFIADTLEKDYSSELRISKYEPPEELLGLPGKTKVRTKRCFNPYFKEYNGLNNIKWYPEKFAPYEVVEISEKIHGFNVRFALLPYKPLGFWNTLKHYFWKLFGKEQKWEYCYGSNTVQLQNKYNHTGFYVFNVYKLISDKYEMESKLKPGETIYGEIYGRAPNGKEIQAGYSYGESELKLVCFDMSMLQSDGTTKWADPIMTKSSIERRGLPYVPVLTIKKYGSMKENEQFTLGPSVLDPNTKVREGCVIKSYFNYDQGDGQKKALKYVSSDYLDNKKNTDWH